MKKDKHIINAIFGDQKVSSGFQTPKDYFEDFEAQLDNKLFEETLPKETGFKVPDNYFDTIEEKVLNTIQSKETKVIPLITRITRFMPAAAAACVLLFLGINHFNNNTNDLTNEEISKWFESNIGQITDNDLEFVLSDVDLKDMSFATALNTNEIEDYLNKVDTATLLNDIEE